MASSGEKRGHAIGTETTGLFFCKDGATFAVYMD